MFVQPLVLYEGIHSFGQLVSKEGMDSTGLPAGHGAEMIMFYSHTHEAAAAPWENRDGCPAHVSRMTQDAHLY